MKKSIDFASAAAFISRPENKRRLSKEGQARVDSGRLRLIPGQLIHRVHLGDGTISNKVSLLDTDTNRADGITDFQGTKLPDTFNVVFNRLRIAYGENAAAGKEGAVSYSNLAEDVAAALANSIFKMEQDNVTVVKHNIRKLLAHSQSVFDTSGASAILQDEDSAFPALNDYGLVAGGIDTIMELIVANGENFEASGANHGYLEFIFDGMITLNA